MYPDENRQISYKFFDLSTADFERISKLLEEKIVQRNKDFNDVLAVKDSICNRDLSSEVQKDILDNMSKVSSDIRADITRLKSTKSKIKVMMNKYLQELDGDIDY